ncbi:RraA family protein [Roseobacter sp. HKCCA0434]|uniref:RraA family protein n=1 Tax=Roseobacter sp. HKCCA0434 TaxID=3079297 RepID=UPI002905AFCD|nr:RraA family protein [Roseobacter sp. HKCCA0434]
MNPTLLDLMRRVDTPTICNAIEVAQGTRGFDAYTRGTMLCSAPGEVMVGYARTAKIMARVPPIASPAEIRKRRMAYYRYMSEGARPAVCVIEDMDFPNAVGAFWGEINTNVHKAFGLSGTLTNGVMRDLGDLPEGYPVVAGSVGPSHAFVHVLDFDTPVTVFGLKVTPGALVHADRHGAVVVPDDVIPQLEAAIRKLIETERIVLDAASGPLDFDSFEAAWTAFEAART